MLNPPKEAYSNYYFKKLDHDFTMRVKFTLTKEWKGRKFIASQLIKLAASVLGCGIEFVE
jgi:hypothetical protein